MSEPRSASRPATVVPRPADPTLWKTGCNRWGEIAASFRVLLVILMVSLHGCGDGPSIPTASSELPYPRPAISDVLLITVDTLRADHLGMYGYFRDTSPNIDRWFTDSRVYWRAYATEAATAPSVATIDGVSAFFASGRLRVTRCTRPRFSIRT